MARPKIEDSPSTLKDGEVLILRACRANGTSRNEFAWPESGEVAAPDWNPGRFCGNGLHGWLRGEGDISAWDHQDDDLWIVAAVVEADCVDLGGKVKFPRCQVLYRGDRDEAVRQMQELYPTASVVYGTATAGDASMATAGAHGTATAGARGTATAGYAGTATAGTCGTATAGDGGTATAGYAGTATAGDAGTATAGARGTATAGARGTATAGYAGTATAGYAGTATAGTCGTATAGDGGTATAGAHGIIQIREWDEKHNRYRVVTGYIGEDGLEPDVKYKLDGGKFIKA